MWEISVLSQAATVFLSILLGAVICTFYDLIRATRKAGANSFFAVFIGDIVFWLVSAVVVFLFLVATTNGEIRGYVLLFAVVGFLLYRLTIGRIVFICLSSVLCFSAKCFKRLVFYIGKFSLYIESRISAFCTTVMRALKKLLKSVYSMVYTTKDKKEVGDDIGEQEQ